MFGFNQTLSNVAFNTRDKIKIVILEFFFFFLDNERNLCISLVLFQGRILVQVEKALRLAGRAQ